MADISPIIDVVFKKLFAVENNKYLLMSLINSIVSEEDQITEIELINPYIMDLTEFDQEDINLIKEEINK